MVQILEHIIKKRNPAFSFDEAISSRVLIQFIWMQFWAFIRGLQVLIYLKKPKGLLAGKNLRLISNHAISWGRFLKLGDNVVLSGLGTRGLTIGNNVGIGSQSKVIVSTSLNNIGQHIVIEDNVGIGEFAYLGGAGGLTIEKDCIVGQYFSCHPENHVYSEIATPIRNQGVVRRGIHIQENCWIGSKVTILDGVSIGKGCVIAAGSVVNKSFPANSIIGGVPAKILKNRI